MRTPYFTTLRRHGDARAPEALVRLLKKKRWPIFVATAEQIHGDQIAVVPALRHPKKFPAVDGLLTDQPNQPLAIFTADCASIFLTDDRRNIVGLLHAGWRGTRTGILKKAVRLIKKRWGISARTLRIWLGPSIGPCCFKVQWDVARYFPRTRRKLGGGGWSVDLAAELQIQARRLDLQFLRNKPAGCTMHTKQFYSYRRDQTNKRMASVIAISG